MVNGRHEILKELESSKILPFVGIYDVFSASIAARYYNSFFLSGFSFSASFYGLPDNGFISWTDMLDFTKRVRSVFPFHNILVDVDDGYGDPEVAAHVIHQLEAAGASGIVLEDQRRPKKCGHFEGKQLLELDDFLIKLKKVLDTRKNMFIVARTDASDEDEIIKRIRGFEEAGADAILVEAVLEISFVKKLSKEIKLPLMVNKIAGGKSPNWTLDELKNAGASLVNLSTPCLFAAYSAIDEAIQQIKENNGLLREVDEGYPGVATCTSLLNENLARRDKR
ncbi:MAG: isocitrate lyase/PEP mutase family protein [Planctomycetes bacterium]|nr:isocitrate lyase/PEP mutase family protein [Planctomycetota bacterium]